VAGHVRKRGPNSFALVYDLPRGLDGKRKQKWQTFAGTKREAEKELTRLLRERDTGTSVDAGRETVASFLIRWLESVRGSLRPTSFNGYEAAIRLHLAPTLGSLLLSRLSPLQIQEYYTAKRAGLSESTLTLHHAVLSTALSRAVRWGLLARNPCALVDAPRPAHTRFPVLDTADTIRLLQAAAGSRCYLPILLAVTLGVCRGEVLGLRWEDVDLWEEPGADGAPVPGGILRVEQTLIRTTGQVYFGPPKRKSRRRSLPLPVTTARALRRHQAEQHEQRRQMGSLWQEHGLVVPKPGGQPWPSGLNQMYRALLDRCGFPSVRFHDLRHSHATQLLDSGESLKVVSERLGHASASITADVYAHVLPGRQAAASRRVDELLAGAAPPRPAPVLAPGLQRRRITVHRVPGKGSR
jgi:integrase